MMVQFSQTRPESGWTTRAGDSSTGTFGEYRNTDAEWPHGADLTEVESARVSVWVTLGLMAAMGGLGASLTGLLAPEGVALGGLGVLMCLVGMFTTALPRIAGRGLAVFGLLLGLAAVALGGVAMTGDVSWPNSHVNEVARLHGWLVDHWSWLDRW
jgi:hypothetical protein